MHRAAEDIPFDFLHMEAIKMLVDESDVDSGINVSIHFKTRCVVEYILG